MQKRSSTQVTELQALAEEQFNRANKLTDELARVKSRKVNVRPKTLSKLKFLSVFSLVIVTWDLSYLSKKSKWYCL